jgi:hypothetical protein
MELYELTNHLNQFKGTGTGQTWVMISITFKNEYIEVLRLDSSNRVGGSNVGNGKQWSIIVDVKKGFTKLQNWKKLKEELGNDLDFTLVKRGENRGKYGIRLYKMSRNMDRNIIEELLNFIFE